MPSCHKRDAIPNESDVSTMHSFRPCGPAATLDHVCHPTASKTLARSLGRPPVPPAGGIPCRYEGPSEKQPPCLDWMTAFLPHPGELLVHDGAPGWVRNGVSATVLASRSDRHTARDAITVRCKQMSCSTYWRPCKFGRSPAVAAASGLVSESACSQSHARMGSDASAVRTNGFNAQRANHFGKTRFLNEESPGPTTNAIGHARPQASRKVGAAARNVANGYQGRDHS